MRTLVVGLVILLAGCSEPSSPGNAEPPSPDPEVRRTPLDTTVSVEVPESCAPGFCYMAGSPMRLHTVALDETVESIVLGLGASEGFDSAVDWEVTCRAPDEENAACRQPLGQGHDPLPLHLEFLDLDLPPATVVSLLLAAPTAGHPAVDMAQEPTRGKSHVIGQVISIALPPELLPRFEYRQLTVAWEGDSGPCALLVDPDCVTVPGAYYAWQNLDGTVVAANLTLTWSSTSPADEVFRLSLGGRCEPSCPSGVAVRGRSPLRIDVERLDLGDDPFAFIYHADPTGVEPVGLVFIYTGTKTPFLLEGTLTLRTLAEAEA